LIGLKVFEVFSGSLRVVEGKTGKMRHMRFPESVREAVNVQIEHVGLRGEEYLFYGRERGKPITRQYAYRVFKAVGEEMGLTGLGTHSMRKTYAYNVLLASKNFEHVKESLNHAYLSTTFLYLIDGLTALLPKAGKLGIPPSIVEGWEIRNTVVNGDNDGY